MSIPETSDTPVETIETKVNSLVEQMSVDGWTPPDDVDESLLYAAKAEKRRRDTQSQFTKQQQQLKAYELTNTRLAEQLEVAIMESLPLKQQNRLEELKATDPELWRQELGKLELAAKGELATKIETITKESSQLSETDRRVAVLEEFLKANPGITAEMLDEDVPPRITKKLADGTITFEQFLEESTKFLTAKKVIATGDKAPDYEDLSKAAGGSNPGANDVEKSYDDSYIAEVY